MHRNITIDEKAYNLLASLKLDPRDSFTKVILRHVRKPADTCGELLDRLEAMPPPPIDEAMLKKVMAGRGRRSNRPRR
jgi:predicted CopG family antitoxin